MKKILTVSLVAMMAVSGARADLASTAYVDTVAAAEASAAQAAAEAKVTALTEGAVATNTADITAIKTQQATQDGLIQANTNKFASYSTTEQMNAAIGTAVSNATGDNSALAGRVTTAEEEIDALQTSLAEGGTTANAIKAAADAAAAADAKAQGAVNVNTSQQTAIEAAQSAANAAQATADKKQNALTAGDFIQIEEGTGANQGKTFIKTTYTAGANVDISDTGVISATDTVYDDTEVRGLIGDNATAIATNKADIDAINGGATGIAGMVVSGNPTEGAGKYALTAIVDENNIITGYKWELIDRAPND